MRKLSRPPCKLPTLVSSTVVELKKAHREQWTARPDEAFNFVEHWKKADVRGALLAMHGWVCSYCESELSRGDRGDVEHFRPKSAGPHVAHKGYWWLAYEFDNYFLSCRVCNSERKGDKFPIKEGTPHVGYAQRERLGQEARLLMNPADDAVESWLYVDWEDKGPGPDLCQVEVRPLEGEERQRAGFTVEFFELNTDGALLGARARLREEVTRLHRKRRFAEIRRLASRFSAHGATVRAYITKYLSDEVLLPSRDEEFEWLLEDVDERLQPYRALEDSGERPADPGMRDQLYWMLAVLWLHPPAWDGRKVEEWLARKGWKEDVEPFRQRLLRAAAAAEAERVMAAVE